MSRLPDHVPGLCVPKAIFWSCEIGQFQNNGFLWPDTFEIFLTYYALDCHNRSRDSQLNFNLDPGSSVSPITIDCDDDVNNIDMNRVGFQNVLPLRCRMKCL